MSVSAGRGPASIWPTTNWGRVAAGLFAGFAVFFLAFIVLAATGQRGGDTLLDNLWLTIPGLLGGVCAAASLVAGGIGIAFRQERSPVVIVTTAVGLLATLFVTAELVLGG